MLTPARGHVCLCEKSRVTVEVGPRKLLNSLVEGLPARRVGLRLSMIGLTRVFLAMFWAVSVFSLVAVRIELGQFLTVTGEEVYDGQVVRTKCDSWNP